MPDADEDLRATSESIQDDAGRLEALEEEKAGVATDDPRLSTLSREAERLAHNIAAKATVERALTDELQGG